MSKIHFSVNSECACGTTSKFLTTTHESVTCAKCKSYIAKGKLRRRSDFESCPTFDVTRSEGGGQLSFKCPVCGKTNIHGSTGAHQAYGAGDGYRVSKCACWKSFGYQLREVK